MVAASKKGWAHRKPGSTGHRHVAIVFWRSHKAVAIFFECRQGLHNHPPAGCHDTRPVPTLSTEDFEAVCGQFRGAIRQIPPMVSALKVDGKRLYKLAREGITVERKARDVTINSLDVVAFDAQSGVASLRVDCTKGTYIRSLVTDIGDAIGCGAHVTVLRRTHVSPFQGAAMVSLEELENAPDPLGYLLPLDSGLAHMAAVKLSLAGLAAFRNGQPGEGEFIGLGASNGEGLWRPKRVLQL